MLRALIKGLDQNFSPGDTFVLPSGTFRSQGLIDAFAAYLVVMGAVAQAKAAFHIAVDKERKVGKATLALREEMRTAIAARVGKSSVAMATYGFTPAKVPVRSARSKLLASVKAEATREARGTKGRVEKLAIHGGVTDVVITPVTSDGSPPVRVPREASGGARADDGTWFCWTRSLIDWCAALNDTSGASSK